MQLAETTCWILVRMTSIKPHCKHDETWPRVRETTHRRFPWVSSSGRASLGVITWVGEKRLHHQVFTTKELRTRASRLHHWRSLHRASRPRIEQDHGSSSRHERATSSILPHFIQRFSGLFVNHNSTCLNGD